VHGCAILALFLGEGPATKANASPLQPDRFVGAAGCKSSSCHGGAGEKRSQYLTWVRQDFHSRAYAVLVTARSARMAEALALPAAQSSVRCTVCHSPFQSVPSVRLTKTAQLDEGVSCEDCHGAAGSWLRGHTRRDWTYATRVGAGMHDLRNLYVRANTCVACHQNLETDLLQAGHPALTFELDGQSVAEPKHWLEEEKWSGPRAWLVGQAVALREMSWALANDRPVGTEATTRWDALAWLLAKTTANQPSLRSIDPLGGAADRAKFAVTQEQADWLARQAAAIPWDERRTRSILQAALAAEPDFRQSVEASPELLFWRAVRLVLALDRLARALDQPVAGSTTPAALRTLYDDIGARPDFQPAKFATDLATFRTTMDRTP
jgi:hypothetical protein